MTPFEVTRGEGPIVLAMPHTGTYLPADALDRLNDTGRALADTDWHIDRLYGGLVPDATIVRANFHRYCIDANRDPSGQSLYPGQNTTGLCPLTDFEGVPIYREGQEPDADEIDRRRLAFHAPYHEALSGELERIRARHGFAILYDCHSIRSQIAFLFEGRLPDLNIGTNDGVACASRIEAAVRDDCANAEGFTSVLNGRFKGGWTTRHYGRPHEGLHAIQMEIAQIRYMDEAAPWTYRPERADSLRVVLGKIFDSLSLIASEMTANRE